LIIYIYSQLIQKTNYISNGTVSSIKENEKPVLIDLLYSYLEYLKYD